MVTAYWGEPLYQPDIARWLGTKPMGTPSSRVSRLTHYGFDVLYQEGSLERLESWLSQKVPAILFLRTGELPYWQIDTAHAVVLAGLSDEQAYLFDPAYKVSPVRVDVDSLMLAWLYSDYTYAVIRPSQ
jgi:hypothetical protein